MQQFLAWVEARPRAHAEIRDAWSSTCPLNCTWEDALAEELVEYDVEGRIALTDRGQARLVGRVDPGDAGGNPPGPASGSAGCATLHPPYA